MKYYVKLPDGLLLKEDGVAKCWPLIEPARKAAKANCGTVGRWDWQRGRFVAWKAKAK